MSQIYRVEKVIEILVLANSYGEAMSIASDVQLSDWLCEDSVDDVQIVEPDDADLYEDWYDVHDEFGKKHQLKDVL